MFNFGYYDSLPTLFACFLGFDIPTYFIFIENVFYYSCFHCFFFRNGVNILCGLQKYWCKLYHMKSYNCTFVCKFIKICSSMKVSLVYINYLCILFNLQMMSILYFTYSTVCSPTRSSVCHCVNHSVFQCLS